MAKPDDLAPPKRDERALDEADQAAVLSRRAVFVGGALGSLALPALVGCSDPQPCLSIAVPSEPTTASTTPPSSSAAPSATAPAAPTSTPVEDGTFAITRAEAAALRLPAVGFRVTMKQGGFTVSGASSEQYVRASGPPGGPLTFLAKPYNDGVSDQAALEVLFRKALSDWSGLDPVEKGASETVTLGGKKLEAQAFRTGKSLATTNWCVVKVPAAKGARDGVLFLFGTGTGESTKPTCKASLEHQALAEIVSTLAFEE